jgi:hypothetical protein
MCVVDDARKVPDDFEKKLRRWRWKAMRWRWMQFGFGMISIFLSLTVATFSSELEGFPSSFNVSCLKLATFFNALAVTAISTFNMGDRATAARQACRELEAAMLSYKWNPEFTIIHLTKAFELAQTTMGHPNLHLTTGK